MSRTYRSNPRSKFEYESGVAILVEHGPYLYTIPHFRQLSKGGWKEAKRLLSKEDYAQQRKLRGDKFTRDLMNHSVPRWYRHELEKQHRFHNKRELFRFQGNFEYEVMTSNKPSGTEFYYWY